MNFLIFAGSSGGIVELLPDRYKLPAMSILAFVLHNGGLFQAQPHKPQDQAQEGQPHE